MSRTLLEHQGDEANRLLDQWLHGNDFVVIGKSVARVDGLDKVLGRSKYMEDYFSKDMLFARLVKSVVSSAYLEKVDFTKATAIQGFVGGITAKDITGKNQVGYLLLDQPAFADDVIRFHGEPVGLVLAKTPEAAEEASRLVRVVCREKAAIFDPLEAIKSSILVHEEKKSNVAFTTKVRKGEVVKGFQESDVVVENTYRTGYQDHAALETEGAVAIPTSEGITIISCNQDPHFAQEIVARVLGCQEREVHSVQPVIGGSFGGKGEMGPILSAQAAVAARKLKKPVMLMYSREDSLTSHCKREPAIIRYRTGATSDGKLKAIDVEIIFEAGAYVMSGPIILLRATMHASGPYIIPHARVDGKLVYTNKVYEGAFRGFGNPQIHLAAESNLDELALKIAMDPIDIRLNNFLTEGSATITSQILPDSVGLAETMKKVAKESSWHTKRKAYGKAVGDRAKGIGVACAYHGVSTSGNAPDWSSGYIIIRNDGSVDSYSGLVEMGQGLSTTITQVVAEALGVDVSMVAVHMGTSDAPDGGATHASRGASVGTMGMLAAARQLRRRLDRMASKMLGCPEDQVVLQRGFAFRRRFKERKILWGDLVNECYNSGVELSTTGYYIVPKGRFDEEKGSGYAYPAFSYMAVVVEVEVDLTTGEVFITRVWPGIAAGRIINPSVVKAQVHGSVAQGLGYALMEEVLTQNGKVLNQNFTDYLIPTVRDMPKVLKMVSVEDPWKDGPFGAKGLGELALVPIAPAIANAVRHATGMRPTEFPMTPERVFNLLNGGDTS